MRYPVEGWPERGRVSGHRVIWRWSRASVARLTRFRAVASHPVRKYRATIVVLDSLGLRSNALLARSAMFCVGYHLRCFASLVPAIRVRLARSISLSEDGGRLLDECGKRGTGVVIVSAHLGDFDIAGAALARATAKSVSAVVDGCWRLANPYHQVRSRAGIILRFPGEGRDQALRADLADGRIVAFMLDRRGPWPEECQLCGSRAQISSAPARLAAEAGAAFIVATVKRNRRRRVVKLEAVSEWPLARGDVASATRVAAALVGEAITAAPHEWLIPTDLGELPLGQRGRPLRSLSVWQL